MSVSTAIDEFDRKWGVVSGELGQTNSQPHLTCLCRCICFMSKKVIKLGQGKEATIHIEWFFFCNTLLNIFHCIYALIIFQYPSRHKDIAKKTLVLQKRDCWVLILVHRLILNKYKSVYLKDNEM